MILSLSLKLHSEIRKNARILLRWRAAVCNLPNIVPVPYNISKFVYVSILVSVLLEVISGLTATSLF